MEEKQNVKDERLWMLPQHSESSKGGQTQQHKRVFMLEGRTYRIQYQSGPSFLATGRTDQLFMEVRVEDPSKPRELEIYTLKRYPVNETDAIAEQIVVDKENRKVKKLENPQTLKNLVSAFYDESKQAALTEHMLNLGGGSKASDFDLMHMYFKHFL